MKKYTAIVASLVLLAALSVSCGALDDGLTSLKLKSYSEEMVKHYIVRPVLTINESAFRKKDIFKDGFSVTEKGKYTITLRSASDSTWSYAQTSDNSQYTVSGLIRMLPDNDLGLHMWECRASILYNEGNGYTSSLETINPAKFYWTDELTETEYTYSIVFDGKFSIDTYLSDKHLDNGVVTFSETATGIVLSSDWELKSYR